MSADVHISPLLKRIETLEAMDREAARVEGVIALRSHRFTGEPPYVGWRGLEQALTEDYDELAALRERVEKAEADAREMRLLNLEIWRRANADGDEKARLKDTSGSSRQDRADLLRAVERIGAAVRKEAGLRDEAPTVEAREEIAAAACAFVELAYDETVEDIVAFINEITEA